MKRVLIGLTLLGTVSGCATVPELPSGGERISVNYSPGGPVCIDCHSIQIDMPSDGKAFYRHWSYNGQYDSEERHVIPFTPELFDQWRAAMARFKPDRSINYGANSVEKTCEIAYFDVPYAVITWENSTEKIFLGLDDGCDPEKHRELIEFLDRFPTMLGIKDVPNTKQWVAATPQG